MINNAMSSGGNSMIRKITRGTSSANGDKTISCSITDTNKVIVLLNTSEITTGYSNGHTTSGSVYLKSISNSNIVVYATCVTVSSSGYRAANITFSYQIIEFM